MRREGRLLNTARTVGRSALLIPRQQGLASVAVACEVCWLAVAVSRSQSGGIRVGLVVLTVRDVLEAEKQR